MRNKTDDQLVGLGWKWVARNHHEIDSNNRSTGTMRQCMTADQAIMWAVKHVTA